MEKWKNQKVLTRQPQGTDRDILSLSHGVSLSSSRGATAMKNKPVIDTNPHLKVPAKYRKA